MSSDLTTKHNNNSSEWISSQHAAKTAHVLTKRSWTRKKYLKCKIIVACYKLRKKYIYDTSEVWDFFLPPSWMIFLMAFLVTAELEGQILILFWAFTQPHIKLKNYGFECCWIERNTAETFNSKALLCNPVTFL